MNVRRFVTSPAGRLTAILALACIGLIAAWVYYRFDQAPREANRVHNPLGYSIIKPKDWSANITTKTERADITDAITLDPEHWIGVAPTMWIWRLPAPPDAHALKGPDGFIDGVFQGLPALVYQRKPKRFLIRRVIFERNGSWFEIGISLPGLEGVRLDDWWRYAESFQIAQLHPASRPVP
ncbi:MAG: hypothetical protein ACREJC_17900 [Tepidisphaeraceae bacterium]